MAFQHKGPLTAFRIADKRHSLFDGTGAALTGGRWNSQGLRAIYGAFSYAGAMLEKLAQSGRVGAIPRTHQFIKIEIPESVKIEDVLDNELPEWNSPNLIESRRYGDGWLQEKRTAILIVPSVIASEEKNILINPEHEAFSLITSSEPKDVIWDPRLFHSSH